MGKSTKTMTVTMTALALFGLSATSSFARENVIADPNAKVDYSGTVSILTKFGLQQLSPYFADIAKEYEKLHPDVTVKLIQETDDSVKDKTKALVATNSLPDIYFSWTGSWGGNFIRGKRAVDLTPVIAPDTDWGSKMTPAAVKAFIYNGKFYGIPLYLDAKFMGYNKKIFADLGLKKPDDFEDFLKSCDVIRQSGITPVSIGNKEAWPLVHYVGQLLAYNVPQETLEQDFDPDTAKYDNPGYVLALEQFKQFEDRCTEGAEMNGTSYRSALQALTDAKSAMYYQEIIEFDQSTGAGSQLKTGDFGFFPLPAPENATGDPHAIEGAPEGYMINTEAENIPLAIDFMKFVTSREHGKILSAPPYGQPSAVIGGADASMMNPSVVEGMAEIEKASYLMPWLDTVNHPRVAAAWLSSLQALAGGSMTPQDVMGTVREASKAVAK
ncbi:ABC transporter substrate-binding protein [Thalassospira sp.]|uniref:ABC transporter substrate-binding protein n=1 Tax=Thalassospira sp. TaxID=1912094 RepID=UPI003AA84F6C